MNDNYKINLTLKEGVLKNKAYTLKPIECPIKLNQNESPFDVPERIKSEIVHKLEKSRWNIYPEFIPETLYEKIANYFNLSKSNLLIGNGSNEMIFTILSATMDNTKKVIIPTPTFTVYNLISSNLNAQIKHIMLKDDFSFDTDKIIEEGKEEGCLTIICSPNNPTGTCMSREEIENVVSKSGGLVVIDEAYIHFGGNSVLDLIEKYNNLIVLRTFSKAFGLAGLRIGIMLSNKNLITELSKVKLPYNLNIFTLITLESIFNNMNFVNTNIQNINSEKIFLEKRLNDFSKLKVIPSSANFFLIKVDDSNYIFNELLKDGILVRDVTGYPMLDNCLRISVGDRKSNLALLKSLERIFK